MKILILSIWSVLTCLCVRCEIVKLVFPENFEDTAQAKYELVYGDPAEPDFYRYHVKGGVKQVDLDFSRYRTNEIMLHRNSNYVCQLHVKNKTIVFPDIVKVTIDASAVVGGTIFIESSPGGDLFFKGLRDAPLNTFYMAVNGKTTTISYKLFGDGKIVPIGVFSLDHASDYTVQVAVNKSGVVSLITGFSLKSKKQSSQ